MNWTKFLTYGDSQQNAFETFCNQLFERYLKRNYEKDLIRFRVINGAGGDGGIEAYGQLNSGNIIAIQSKWFRNVLKDSEIAQIRKSVQTAKSLRPQIKEYIISIPHDASSLKYGRGVKGGSKAPIDNFEEKTIDNFTDEITTLYPDLKITWWFEKDLDLELQQPNNEGVHKFWFDKEIISHDYLSKHFIFQKKSWLHERYIPELHGQGVIHREYQKICFSIQYRKELSKQLDKIISDLEFCITQINHFIPTNTTIVINDELHLIKANLISFSDELQKIDIAVKTGNDLYKPFIISEVAIWGTIMKLKKVNANNMQKNILPKLISSLDKIHKYDLPQYIQHFAFNFNQKIRLILGEPGTGKTHGLTNCVEIHLAEKSPAIIIQAKGTPFKDWTEILSKSLEIVGWQKDEIFSALETLAIKKDVQKATALKSGEEYDSEVTKAIICIDGLEEEIGNEKEWYSRIRECEQLTAEYPRVRFIFSARGYFYNSTEVPQIEIFDSVSLPREGDVAIDEVAPHYFGEDQYNIQLSSSSLIRGINSLFALRLFCEEYRNKSINATDKIVTATRELINLKVEKINKEFISKLQNRKGTTRNPIMDSLGIIANFFYNNHEAEHNQLANLISPELDKYLTGSEIDYLIDYLVDNGFLIRFERVATNEVLIKRKYYYSITYQSLVEHIISEKIYIEIKNGLLNRIPQFLHEAMFLPLDFNPKEQYNSFDVSPNQRIIENIACNIFCETGKLIGENNFLIEGFSEDEVRILQLKAIGSAPKELAMRYKNEIDYLFNFGHKNRNFVLYYLIYPSSKNNDSVFGSDYLHEKLISVDSVFERDKIWSGLDSYELNSLKKKAGTGFFENPKDIVFKLVPLEENLEDTDFTNHDFRYLHESSLHNEEPLVFAWKLSNIDQELRNDSRVALTGWAIKNQVEFLLLLKKIFNCNDPQIQEDLSSIMLGVASRSKDKDSIKELALWSIENIFNHLDIHRNIIVRQGFRAIVERAFQYDVISKEEVEKSRPKPMNCITLIPLESNLSLTIQGECYPIVHDLAWYVIKEAYNDFLEYPFDCEEVEALLNKYRAAYNDNNIFANSWGMAAGIAYIRGLGLSRTEGSWYTQATHGSKSKVFTYEEKYTWLAVHYIQGYLSDYIPAKRWSEKREFIRDYSQIIDIPNPVESIIDLDNAIAKLKIKQEWVVKEVLSKELETGIELKQSITNWVNEEPIFELENWLTFNSIDFQIEEPHRKWLALYNKTVLYDSKELCCSYFSAVACLVEKGDLQVLIKTIESNPDSLHFITHMDGLHSSPKTDTYCNPIDIVWMTWIEEDGTKETFYDIISGDEKYLYNTITEITQNSINGESHICLPSKKIRALIDCYELSGSELKDSNERTLAFNHKKSDGLYQDRQELVLVDKDILEKIIDNAEYEIVWFINLFKEKNPLNKSLDKNFHIQKTRKYFVWNEEGMKKCLKFWDEYFSNHRDEVKR